MLGKRPCHRHPACRWEEGAQTAGPSRIPWGAVKAPVCRCPPAGGGSQGHTAGRWWGWGSRSRARCVSLKAPLSLCTPPALGAPSCLSSLFPPYFCKFMSLQLCPSPRHALLSGLPCLLFVFLSLPCLHTPLCVALSLLSFSLLPFLSLTVSGCLSLPVSIPPCASPPDSLYLPLPLSLSPRAPAAPFP